MAFAPRAPNPVSCLVSVPASASPLGVLVFLHGSEECGTDAQLPLRTGLPVWVKAEAHRWPFVVVVPQKPDKARPWHHYESEVLCHVDAVVAELGLVEAPLVLIGLSQGGHGALHIGARQPQRFSAVVSLCGFARFPQTDPEDQEEGLVSRLADGLSAQCTRLFHGQDDDAVPVAKSWAVHDALKARGADVDLVVFPQTGHNCWDTAFGHTDLAEWLVARLSASACNR